MSEVRLEAPPWPGGLGIVRTQTVTERLVAHLEAEGYKCWREVPLERVAAPMRADVLALKPGFFWEHADVRIYEVKAQRGDFMADVRRGKTQGYRDYAHRVYFAGPQDVVDVALVPPGIGVVHLSEEAVISRQNAEFKVAPENSSLLLYLMARWECYGPAVRPEGKG